MYQLLCNPGVQLPNAEAFWFTAWGLFMRLHFLLLTIPVCMKPAEQHNSRDIYLKTLLNSIKLHCKRCAVDQTNPHKGHSANPISHTTISGFCFLNSTEAIWQIYRTDNALKKQARIQSRKLNEWKMTPQTAKRIQESITYVFQHIEPSYGAQADNTGSNLAFPPPVPVTSTLFLVLHLLFMDNKIPKS